MLHYVVTLRYVILYFILFYSSNKAAVELKPNQNTTLTQNTCLIQLVEFPNPISSYRYGPDRCRRVLNQ